LRKDEFRILSEFARSTTESSSIALRAGIVVLCAAGASDKRSAKLLGITFKTVSKWRRIYAGSQEMIHSQKIWTLRDSIRKALSDDPRSGAPRKISIEAFSMLNKIACESPQSYGYPFSRWSGWSLAEAVRRLTGESMSESSALRGLSAFGLDPSKHELWLRSGSSAEEFALAAVPVLETYKNLDKLIAEGFMIYSTDEKMGIQAIERKMLREAAPAAERGGKGRLASYDPVYVRHGTTGIIASMNLGDGSVIAAIQNKREEIDYATHIRDTFALNPEKRHIFIEDNLNTHQSASLVWLVAMHEAGEDILQIDLEAWRPKEKNEDAGPRLSEQEAAKYAWLGAKGRSGPLKSMESRAGYLGDRTHQICFIHTPKHTSWMNRVECWFSIVSKHLLNYRLSVKSAEELNALIAEYIDFYNKKLRKCHNWKCVEHLLAKFGPIAQKAAKKAA
jgi:predicted transcriptional regulator